MSAEKEKERQPQEESKPEVEELKKKVPKAVSGSDLWLKRRKENHRRQSQSHRDGWVF